MNAHYKLKIFSPFLIVAALAGCAGGKTAFKDAGKAEVTRDYETAMVEYKKALDADPGNAEYRLKFERTRFAAAFDFAKESTGDISLPMPSDLYASAIPA